MPAQPPHPPEIAAELLCHQCGYDLRAHPQDGKCPECGESVAESRQAAAIPRRPAWRNSDPRWRWRMIAGAWVLALLPLMSALRAVEWNVPVPTVFDYRNTVQTLDETLLAFVYEPLVFCIGVVLLLSREHGRRRGKWDWTRPWGVLCSYIALLLSATQVLYLAALVLLGIGAIFHSMPLRYEPGVTDSFVRVSSAYLRYGPYPTDMSVVVLVGVSSIAVLLACIPLFDALRNTGSQRVAMILVAPLGLFALMYLAQAGWYCLAFSKANGAYSIRASAYFGSSLLDGYITRVPMGWIMPRSGLTAFVIEAAKWAITFAMAVWLTIAQFATWRKRGNA